MGNGELVVPSQGNQGPQKGTGRKALSRFGHLPVASRLILKEDAFHATLTIERRRAERSGKPFALMVIDSHAVHKNGNAASFAAQLTSVVSSAARETDFVGWYGNGASLGVIFTEIKVDGVSPITDLLHSKITTALRDHLDHKIATSLVITVHLFPESWDKGFPDRVADVKLYPDLSQKASKKRLPMIVKRAIDIGGSALLLIALAPVLGIVALAIKLSSKGPVLFSQDRLGQFGEGFKCLKFRTMYTNNDPKVHREFVQQFIAGKTANESNGDEAPTVYKLTNDPRVTPVGKFLRKTSLDEFPQFWNVLRGEMSLVGPRPPVPYEFEIYDHWHRRRVLELKPGVTGLWQVSGRSSTCFDDMVRLDLQYSQGWSLWLDLKILLATPRAVFMGDGAF